MGKRQRGESSKESIYPMTKASTKMTKDKKIQNSRQAVTQKKEYKKKASSQRVGLPTTFDHGHHLPLFTSRDSFERLTPSLQLVRVELYMPYRGGSPKLIAQNRHPFLHQCFSLNEVVNFLSKKFICSKI